MARSRPDGPPPMQLPPLPRDTHALVVSALGGDTIPRGGNAGLVWDRYAAVWTADSPPTPAKSEHRTDYLRRFIQDFKRQGEHRGAELRARVERLSSIDTTTHRDYRTMGRLVTGLGSEHPVENGFSFDHTLGVPVLAGSSVKGLCRAGAGLLSADTSLVQRLLGVEHPARSEKPNAPLFAGEVVFLDELPTDWPALDLDLLNTHHPAYYADQGQLQRTRLAVVTEEPKPVSFLTVAHGVRFRFWLRGRGGVQLSVEDTALVWRWMDLGLEALGVGGKTAAGYGHMMAV